MATKLHLVPIAATLGVAALGSIAVWHHTSGGDDGANAPATRARDSGRAAAPGARDAPARASAADARAISGVELTAEQIAMVNPTLEAISRIERHAVKHKNAELLEKARDERRRVLVAAARVRHE